MGTTRTRRCGRRAFLFRPLTAASALLLAVPVLGALGNPPPAAAQGSTVPEMPATVFTSGCNEYQVPAGVTAVQVTAIGAGGAAGQNNSYRGLGIGTIAGGAGGLGASVTTTVSVTPGEVLQADVGGDHMGGGLGGDSGNFQGLPPDSYPGAGGAGGGASWVTDNPVSEECQPDQLLVVAGGGGGGGGAGSDLTWGSGGAGGNAGGAGAQPGGDNANHDGGQGGAGTLSAGGAGGAYGYGTGEAGFPTLVLICTYGNPGANGGAGLGGEGGWGEDDDIAYKDGCSGELGSDTASAGGGGGGGGGYNGGGGGGGGDDYWGGGGGGGAGASYVAGATAAPTPTSDPAEVSIQPVTVLPTITSASSTTCYVGSYCFFTVTAAGFPVPQIGSDSSLPEGLTLYDNGNGTATLSGIPDSYFANGGAGQGSTTYPITLGAGNEFGETATQSFDLTIAYPSITSFALYPNTLSPLVAGSPGEAVVALAQYSNGMQQDVSQYATWASSTKGVATASDGDITPLAAGSTTISATLGSQSASAPLGVTLGDPTQLAITPANPTVGLGRTQQFTAEATYADGQTLPVTSTVTWTAQSLGEGNDATVTSGGLATATGGYEGAVDEVAATLQNADGTSIGTDTQITTTLAHPTGVSVSAQANALASGLTEALTATGAYPGGRSADITSGVTWTSSNNLLATVDSDGNVYADPNTEGGNVTFTATSPDGTQTGSTTVTILPGTPTSIQITPNGSTIGLGQTQQLTATAYYLTGQPQNVTSDVTWSSTNPGVVSVSSSGVAEGTGTAGGAEANITASLDGVTGSSLDSLSLADPTSITISPLKPTMSRGQDLNFTATGTYPNGFTANITSDVSWTSSNTSIARFNSYSLVANNTVGGTTTATATAANGTSAATAVTVLQGDPYQILVTPATATLGLGLTEQLTATAYYSNNTTANVTDQVVWTAGGGVAVNATGLVTATSTTGQTGYATAVLTMPDGNSYPASDSISVSLANPSSISVSPSSGVSLEPGTVQDYSATGTYPGGYVVNITSIVAWSVSNPNTGSVDSYQFEAGNTAGPDTITATAAGGETGSATEQSLGDVGASGPTSDTTVAGQPYASGTFTATGGSGSYTWSLNDGPGLHLSSTSGSSVTIEGTPTESSNNAGYVGVITVTDANDQYNEDQIEFSLTVTAVPQTISFTPPPTGVVDSEITLSATGGGSGNPVSFSTTSAACGMVSSTVLLFESTGECVVDADQYGSGEYANAPEVQATITVFEPQSVAFSSPAPTGVVVGSPSLTPSVSHSVSISPVVLSVDSSTTNGACTISSGTVSFVHAGVCVIDANAAGNSTYAPAPQAQQDITVGQAAQSVEFTSVAPSAVTVGGTYNPTAAAAPGSGNPVTITVDPTTTNGACTISSGTVSFVHAGTCDLDAAQAGDADYLAAAAGQSIPVGPAGQAITFSPPPVDPEVGATYSVSATGGASGEPVTFSVDPSTTNGACTVANGDTVDLLAEGTCVLDANEAGNADYSAAPQATQSFSVRQLLVQFESAPFTAGASSSPATPFTVELVGTNGLPTTSSTAQTINLESSSAGGVFSTALDGAPVTSLTIPAGSETVSGYYGDTVSGQPALVAYDLGIDSSSPQIETITAGSFAALHFSTEPSDVVTGSAEPPVSVTATDQFGNPVPGGSVTLTDSLGGISGSPEVTTGSNGVATFPGLSFSKAGSDTLTATSGSLQSSSSAFGVFAPLVVTSVSPSSGPEAGGNKVTIHGSGLDGVQSVLFGAEQGTNLDIVSNSEVTVTAPASPSGSVDIAVENDVESSVVTSSTVYDFLALTASTTVLSAAPSSPVLGGTVKITATVSGDGSLLAKPTGTVAFYDGSTELGTATVSSSVATLSTAALSSASNALTATYSGDANYGRSTSAVLDEFVKDPVTVTISPSSDPISTGNNVVFTISVAGNPQASGFPSGSVTLSANGTQLGTATLYEGETTLSTASLPTGTNDVTASYSGDSGYTAGSGSTTVTSDGPATVTFSSASSTTTFGKPAVFTATVSGTPEGGVPTGTVTFMLDGASDSAPITLSSKGTATLTTSTLGLGTHALWAVYSGGGDYTQGASSHLAHTVDDGSVISLTTSQGKPLVDSLVTFTATVKPTGSLATNGVVPTGTITFYDGSTALETVGFGSSGVVTLNFSGYTLGAGTDEITAAYSGDANFASSSSKAVTETVTVPTVMDMYSTDNPSVEGSPVVLVAQVGGIELSTSRTGTVTFTEGTTVLETVALPPTGAVDYTSSSLAFGTTSITATYSGDSLYRSASAPAFKQMVLAKPTVAVTSSADPAAPGSSVTFTATVTHPLPEPGAPTGTVTFMDGSTTLAADKLPSSGTVTFTTASLGLGYHGVTAVYSGNTKYAGQTSSVLEQGMLDATTALVTSNDNPANASDSITLDASVSAAESNEDTPTGSVEFLSGSTNIGSASLDSNGNASLNVPAYVLGNGTADLTIQYSGDNTFAPSTSPVLDQVVNSPTTVDLSSSINPVGVGDPVTFYVDVAGNPGDAFGYPTGTVTFVDGSTTLGTSTINVSGEAMYETSTLSNGDHDITAVYSGDSNYDPSTSNLYTETVGSGKGGGSQSTQTSLTAAPNPVDLGSTTLLTATVVPLGSSGEPTGTVTFTAGAQILGTEPVNVGQASLPLNSSALGTAGTYSIIATYSGDSNFAGSTSLPLSLVVQQGLPVPSITITPSENPASPGDDVTFAIQVSGGSGAPVPTGTITVTDQDNNTVANQTLDKNGDASFTVDDIAAGELLYQVSYSGDANYSAASQPFVEPVGTPVTVTLTSSENPSNSGDTVTFDVSVAGNPATLGVPTGSVILGQQSGPALAKLGSASLDSNGDASFQISSLAVGTDTIVALYQPSDGYLSGSASVNQVVNSS